MRSNEPILSVSFLLCRPGKKWNTQLCKLPGKDEELSKGGRRVLSHEGNENETHGDLEKIAFVGGVDFGSVTERQTAGSASCQAQFNGCKQSLCCT